MTHAIITGAAGQDGILLSQALLGDGLSVTGLVKPGTDVSSLLRYSPQIALAECDLGSSSDLRSLLMDVRPDQIYNLGGISSIVESEENPELTQRVNVGAVETILRAQHELGNGCRFVQAASGTVFEGSDVSPQVETTPRAPKTAYAVAKAHTLDLIAEARDRHGSFASAAILYNHESPLRGSGFVTRRITEGVARIATGRLDVLELGNIDVCRDWGWAPDYVRGMRLMMQAPAPGDYILATGEVNYLRDFLAMAFAVVGISEWEACVRTREDLKRATDPSILRGDSSKAERELGWTRTKSFAEIAEAMVAFDLLLLEEPDALWHES